MRDPDRRARILNKLAALWDYDKDSRFCQLVSNALPSGTIELFYTEFFYTEDDFFEKRLDDLLLTLRHSTRN